MAGGKGNRKAGAEVEKTSLCVAVGRPEGKFRVGMGAAECGGGISPPGTCATRTC